MSQKTAKVQSIYGPVGVDLYLCDGVECTKCSQEEFMIGWFRLEPLGTTVRTMGSVPDPLDFCSLDCLSKVVRLMTGS